jgi:hypothetical protein
MTRPPTEAAYACLPSGEKSARPTSVAARLHEHVAAMGIAVCLAGGDRTEPDAWASLALCVAGSAGGHDLDVRYRREVLLARIGGRRAREYGHQYGDHKCLTHGSLPALKGYHSNRGHSEIQKGPVGVKWGQYQAALAAARGLRLRIERLRFGLRRSAAAAHAVGRGATGLRTASTAHAVNVRFGAVEIDGIRRGRLLRQSRTGKT